MTEHNIFQEAQEEYERQRIEALWKRYGSWIMIVAMAVVVATAGVSAYRGWQAEHMQKLTASYLEAAKQDSAPDKGIAMLEQFADSNPGTNHADLAILYAGGLAINQNDLAKAAKLFDAVAHDPTADPAFRQLGDLLSVRVQMDSGDPKALSARLDPLTSDSGVWHYSALEEQGFLALKAGDKDKAKQIFTSLSQDARAPTTLSDRASDIVRGLD